MDKKQVRVMFVCHGNICRSPMAEVIFRDMVRVFITDLAIGY